MSTNTKIIIAVIGLMCITAYALHQQKKENERKDVEEIKDKELESQLKIPVTATPPLVLSSTDHVGLLNMVDDGEDNLVNKIFN